MNMTRLQKRVAAAGLRIAAALTLAGALLPVPGASVAYAAQVWQVQVGGMGGMDAPMQNGVSLNAYFPDPLTIRAGDTVTWSFTPGDPHTVTFNSGQPPLPSFLPGPNPGELTIGPASAPVGPPSSPGQPIIYDGTQQLSSGANTGPNSPSTYSLTFTAPGVYGYVCMLHPGMRGQITVVPAGTPLQETPAQATARGEATMAYLASRMEGAAAAVQSVTNGPVHTAVAGIADAYGASAMAFLPGTVTVQRGDTVVWTMADPFELHTITFTSGEAPPNFVQPRPRPGGPPQLVIPASTALATGGSTYGGSGVVNSGLLREGDAYALVFDAPPGTYQYQCIIHPNMKGTITVTG